MSVISKLVFRINVISIKHIISSHCYYHWFAFTVPRENQGYWSMFLCLRSWEKNFFKVEWKENKRFIPKKHHCLGRGQKEWTVSETEVNYKDIWRTTNTECFKNKSKATAISAKKSSQMKKWSETTEFIKGVLRYLQRNMSSVYVSFPLTVIAHPSNNRDVCFPS